MNQTKSKQTATATNKGFARERVKC